MVDDESMVNKIEVNPTQLVKCPHCEFNHHISGGGRFTCPKCRRIFTYYGPFEFFCTKCSKQVTKGQSGKDLTVGCLNCGQEYIIREEKLIGEKNTECVDYCIRRKGYRNPWTIECGGGCCQ